MRAVVVERYGPPEVLTVAEVPVPQPAEGKVRIRVRAGAVQPFDTYVRRGLPGFRMALPRRLGNEFTGYVDAVGDGVTRWSAGQEVLGWAAMRSLADFVVADADAIVPRPADMSVATAGALGASGQTALTALRELRVGAGDTVLVHAAAGGVGSMAVQLASHDGATVIGTASTRHHDYLRSLGALPISYGPGLADRVRALAPDGVDAVLDAIGGQALHDSLGLGADRARIGTLVDHTVAEQLGVLGIRATRSGEQLRELTNLHQRGALHVTVRATYPLRRIAEAHRDVEQGHGRGKVLVLVDETAPTPSARE